MLEGIVVCAVGYTRVMDETQRGRGIAWGCLKIMVKKHASSLLLLLVRTLATAS
jgi:hypothetical protein